VRRESHRACELEKGRREKLPGREKKKGHPSSLYIYPKKDREKQSGPSDKVTRTRKERNTPPKRKRKTATAKAS